MQRKRNVLLALALILIVASWWQVTAARRGLVVRSLTWDGIPMLYVAPTGAGAVPGVLVAHGFAGSKQLMLGYAYTLAHAGYAVMLWDFGGHGSNAAALQRETTLQGNIDAALAALLAQPEVEGRQVALLGHSMGSGAVMNAGIRDPQRYAAVVAVSPTAAPVTPREPANLLLQAGSWEGRFIANAANLLSAAGGPSDDFAGGRARRLIVIPNAEHISILFHLESHRATLDWLDRTFGRQTVSPYADRRILWYVAQLVGWLTLWAAASQVSPKVRVLRIVPAGRKWVPWVGLGVGALAAVGLTAGLDRLTPLQGFGGLLVGGAVALWLLIAGLVWLGVNRLRPGLMPADLAWGLGLFAALWLAFGAMAQLVWVQWLLIPARLWRWPLLGLACLPWFLAAGAAQLDKGTATRVAWWLGQSAAMVGGLLLTLTLVPSLGFLVLLMPIVPIVLGVMVAAGAAFERLEAARSGRASAWVYGLGASLFFGWVLAAVFPLAG